MYCKNCGKEINTEQAVCLNCGVKNGIGNKFCSYCGKEVDPLAEICLNCGMAIKKGIPSSASSSLTKEDAYKKLAEHEKNSAIIWFVIAAIQILIGCFTYYTPVLVGAWNIYAGITRMKYSKSLLEMPSGVYEYFEKQGTSNIVFLIINLFLGGIIGAIASAYDIYIRKFVMDNKDLFE